MVIVWIALAVLFGFVVVRLLAKAVLRKLLENLHTQMRELRPEAAERVTSGSTPEEVGGFLLAQGLPPTAAVRIVCDVTDLEPRAAIDTLRPILSAQQSGLLDRMPEDRLQAVLAKYPDD
jgi:hypothetical protein